MAIPNFFAQSQASMGSGFNMGQQIQQNRLAQAMLPMQQELAQSKISGQNLQNERYGMQNEATQRQMDTNQKNDSRIHMLQNAALLISAPFEEQNKLLPMMMNEFGSDPYIASAINEITAINDPVERNTQLIEFMNAAQGQVPGMGGGEKAVNMLEKVDPDLYTPDSIQAFADSGQKSYKLLVPREDKKGVIAQRKLELLEIKQAADMKKKEIDLIQKQKDVYKIAEMETAEATDIVNLITDVTSKDLDLIYGSEEFFMPDWARSQAGHDLTIQKDKIVSSLKLAAAGKLKGQGTITENERAMLGDAATLLNNPLLSAKEAADEFDRIAPVFNKIIKNNADALAAGPTLSAPKIQTTGNAPPAALSFLEQNPDQIDFFIQQYGYRPEGY